MVTLSRGGARSAPPIGSHAPGREVLADGRGNYLLSLMGNLGGFLWGLFPQCDEIHLVERGRLAKISRRREAVENRTDPLRDGDESSSIGVKPNSLALRLRWRWARAGDDLGSPAYKG